MTVLTHQPPKTRYSTKVTWVRSASGHLSPLRNTQKIKITEPKSGKTVHLPILIDECCPVNLIGRDVMVKLGISVRPTAEGKMVAEFEPSEPVKNINVVAGPGEPLYYWTLDMTDREESESLLSQALTELKQITDMSQVDIMPTDQLHCTLRYKTTPGPDPLYDDKVNKLSSPQSLLLKDLLVSRSGQACVTVTLNPKQQVVNRNRNPHVSLTKNVDQEWQNMFLLTTRAESDSFTVSDETGWQTGRLSGIRKRPLCIYVTARPASHMDSS